MATGGWLDSGDVHENVVVKNLLKLWSCALRLPEVVTCSLKKAVRKDLIKSLT